jgi:hypothetical protein
MSCWSSAEKDVPRERIMTFYNGNVQKSGSVGRMTSHGTSAVPLPELAPTASNRVVVEEVLAPSLLSATATLGIRGQHPLVGLQILGYVVKFISSIGVPQQSAGTLEIARRFSQTGRIHADNA